MRFRPHPRCCAAGSPGGAALPHVFYVVGYAVVDRLANARQCFVEVTPGAAVASEILADDGAENFRVTVQFKVRARRINDAPEAGITARLDVNRLGHAGGGIDPVKLQMAGAARVGGSDVCGCPLFACGSHRFCRNVTHGRLITRSRSVSETGGLPVAAKYAN